jgi:hypothetical protein
MMAMITKTTKTMATLLRPAPVEGPACSTR